MPAVAPSLRYSVLVYQSFTIDCEPPHASRYSASDCRSLTARSPSSTVPPPSERRGFLTTGAAAASEVDAGSEGVASGVLRLVLTASLPANAVDHRVRSW